MTEDEKRAAAAFAVLIMADEATMDEVPKEFRKQVSIFIMEILKKRMQNKR